MLRHSNHQEERIAYFVTAHGLGHAARSCAVMQAMLDVAPALRFEVFTDAPQWFFLDSLNTNFGFHRLDADIGMIQASPFKEDTAATLDRLKGFLPFDPVVITDTADTIKRLRCRLVVCDIAPLGLAVADAAGIPGVLIENFTWDWIYAAYAPQTKKFLPYIEYLEKQYHLAIYHIQTEPVCRPGSPDLTAAPASRKPRCMAAVIRSKLGIKNNRKMVLITMGGVSDRKDYVSDLSGLKQIHFVLAGAGGKRLRLDNVTLLPPRSDFYHPDLIAAADAVVGKAGYSTIAEVYQNGKPFGYVPRITFRESSVLEKFINDHLAGLPLPEKTLQDGSWVERIPDLLDLPAEKSTRPNGADEIAEFLLKRL